MKPNLLAQAVQFPQIIRDAFGPAYVPGRINVTDINLKLGGIISAVLPYIFVFSGLMLFLFLIFGGFQLLASGGNPESVKSGQGKVTGALIGFIIIFVAYWLVEILQIVFGIDILR